MIEYIIDYTPELKKKEISPELSALAEQVKTLLSMYSPDDQAVVALKSSPAYQKVAWTIEDK